MRVNSGGSSWDQEGWEGLSEEALFKLTSEYRTWRSQQCEGLRGLFQGEGAARERKHLGATKEQRQASWLECSEGGRGACGDASARTCRPSTMMLVRSLHFCSKHSGKSLKECKQWRDIIHVFKQSLWLLREKNELEKEQEWNRSQLGGCCCSRYESCFPGFTH